MNAGQLKKLIENIPDSTPLIRSSSDHSYRDVDAQLITALRDKRGNWSEDYGEKITSEKDYGKRLSVILFD